MKKGDILIISAVFILAAVISLFWFFGKENGTTVKITRDNETLYEVSLNKDRTIDLETNTVKIANGKVWVEKATCENQICVNHIPVSKSGEVIACLPNKLIVEIE